MPSQNRRKFLSSFAVAMTFTSGCSLRETNVDSTLKFSADERVGSRLSVAGNTAFFTTDTGALYSASLDADETNWKRTVSDSRLTTTPAPHGDSVYGGENTMFGFSSDGTEQWRFSFFDRLSTAYVASVPPLVEDGEVVVGLTNGTLCALSADDGTLRWTRPVGDESCHRWSAYDGKIAAGTPGGAIAVVDLRDESVQRRGYREPIAPTLGPDGVYVGGQHVRKLSTDLSAERWAVETDAQYTYLPTVADGQVFVSGSNEQGDAGYLYSIDAESGELDWQRTLDDGIAGYPLVDSDAERVVVGTVTDGTVHVLDYEGETLGSTDLDSGVSGPLRRYDDGALALTKSGRIYSLVLP